MSHPTTYKGITKIFHWLTALLILLIIPLGMIANQLPYETSEQLALKATVFSLHKTLGVAVFFVASLRVLWALTQAKPGPIHPERKLEIFAAEVVHWILYISLIAVPLTGWMEHAATSGFAPIWWPYGQSLFFVPKSEAVAGVFAGLHWIFGKLMILSLLLHVAGALKHHFINQDATLRRMWFGKDVMPVVDAHITSAIPRNVAALVFVIASGVAYNSGLLEKHGEIIEVAALEAVTSDWAVQEGDIAITITQFGSEVTGNFGDWTSEISFDPAPADVMGDVTTVVSIGSLTLGSVTDEALKTDFFDVATHPTATFAAEIKPDGENFVADGTMTIKGISMPLKLPFEMEVDGDTASMTGTTTLNRTDFKVGESQSQETSLGFDVIVNINLTAIKAE